MVKFEFQIVTILSIFSRAVEPPPSDFQPSFGRPIATSRARTWGPTDMASMKHDINDKRAKPSKKKVEALMTFTTREEKMSMAHPTQWWPTAALYRTVAPNASTSETKLIFRTLTLPSRVLRQRKTGCRAGQRPREHVPKNYKRPHSKMAVRSVRTFSPRRCQNMTRRCTAVCASLFLKNKAVSICSDRFYRYF